MFRAAPRPGSQLTARPLNQGGGRCHRNSKTRGSSRSVPADVDRRQLVRRRIRGKHPRTLGCGGGRGPWREDSAALFPENFLTAGRRAPLLPRDDRTGGWTSPRRIYRRTGASNSRQALQAYQGAIGINLKPFPRGSGKGKFETGGRRWFARFGRRSGRTASPAATATGRGKLGFLPSRGTCRRLIPS